MADSDQLEQLLQRVLEAVPAGVVHVSSQGAILRANPRACRFLGLAYDELTHRFTVDFSGQTFFEDGSPCPVEDYPVTRCLVTGEAQGPVTIGVEQPSGSVRWAIFTAMPDREGDGSGAVVTLVDITERVDAEKERQILQRRLELSNRLATVGSLAAGLAHEINNPLTYILGNLSLALDELAPEQRDLRALLTDATQGAERVTRIVADLGRLAQIEDVPGPVDVGRAAAVAAAIARSELKHRAPLQVQVDGLPPVVGATDKLMQLLLNLLLHCGKAIQAGAYDHNRLVLSGSVLDGRVRLTLESTARVQAADDPGSRALAWSISRSLVDELDGTLDVEHADAGTTVIVSLRRAPGHTPHPADPRHRTPTPGPATRRLRILVVDDEPEIRQLVAAFLAEHDVMTVGSGRQAIAVLDQRWDLVLCDLMMPELTGMDVFEHAEDGVRERLVFMTGGAYTEAAQRFMATHGPAVLHKPFGGKDLKRLVAKFG